MPTYYMLIKRTLFDSSVDIMIFDTLEKALNKEKRILDQFKNKNYTIQKLPNQTAKYNIHKDYEDYNLSLKSFKSDNLNYAIITKSNSVQIIMPNQHPDLAFKQAVLDLAKLYPEHKSFGLRHNHSQNATVLFLNKEHQPVASAGFRHGSLS